MREDQHFAIFRKKITRKLRSANICLEKSQHTIHRHTAVLGQELGHEHGQELQKHALAIWARVLNGH